jgi:hypothetical protein
MFLETQLAAATTRECYVAILKVTLIELATALCRLAEDKGLQRSLSWNRIKNTGFQPSQAG